MPFHNNDNLLIGLFFLLLFQYINNFYILPFDTIIIKDETIKNIDYHSNLTQNELYVNLSMGNPKQDFKSILKMDKYGFVIYEGALKYNLSNSLEKVDEDFSIGWGSSYDYTPLKDNFYLISFNSYNDFNNNKKTISSYNITKTNKITFLRIEPKNGTSYYFNKMFNNYGIIGLKLNTLINFNAPELIPTLRNLKEIKTYTFSFKFENNLKNGFTDNNNKGYLIIGEELTDDENEIDEIKYEQCENVWGELSWALKFDKIYTKINNNGNKNEDIKKNFVEFNGNLKMSEILANYPYLIGPKEYFQYINTTFFDKLVEQKYCYCNKFIKQDIFYYDLYSYICDSKTKYFMDYLNNNFPDLVFEHKKLGINFTLTKNDLFEYNTLNDSDTNLYFLIVNYFDDAKNSNWYFGIPFLKKYRLSFDYDSRIIGYYKNDGKIINKKDKKENNKNENNIFIIIIIVILILLLLLIVFGIILYLKNIKKSRKKKANELDDNYEYEPYKEQINNDNNNCGNYNKIGIEGIN